MHVLRVSIAIGKNQRNTLKSWIDLPKIGKLLYTKNTPSQLVDRKRGSNAKADRDAGKLAAVPAVLAAVCKEEIETARRLKGKQSCSLPAASN